MIIHILCILSENIPHILQSYFTTTFTVIIAYKTFANTTLKIHLLDEIDVIHCAM